jgi:hypothetical protein
MTDSGGNVLSEANGLMIKLLPHQPREARCLTPRPSSPFRSPPTP